MLLGCGVVLFGGVWGGGLGLVCVVLGVFFVVGVARGRFLWGGVFGGHPPTTGGGARERREERGGGGGRCRRDDKEAGPGRSNHRQAYMTRD